MPTVRFVRPCVYSWKTTSAASLEFVAGPSRSTSACAAAQEQLLAVRVDDRLVADVVGAADLDAPGEAVGAPVAEDREPRASDRPPRADRGRGRGDGEVADGGAAGVDDPPVARDVREQHVVVRGDAARGLHPREVRHAVGRAVAARQAQRGEVVAVEAEHGRPRAHVAERDGGRVTAGGRREEAVAAGDDPRAAGRAVGGDDALRAERALERGARAARAARDEGVVAPRVDVRAGTWSCGGAAAGAAAAGRSVATEATASAAARWRVARFISR